MGRSRVDTSRKRAAVRGRARTGWGSRLLGIAGLACAVAAVAPAVAPAAGEPCSNAEVRAQQRVSHIEGCRAYEKVSPADKGGANVGGFTYDAKSRASADGQSLVFTSTAAFGDSLGSPFPAYYTARRGSAGWSVRSATPPSQSTLVYEHGAALGRTASVLYVDPTLETRIVETAAPIAPGSVSGVPSQYSWNGNGYDLLNPGGPGLVPALGFAAPSFQAATPDGRHVLFSAAWDYPSDPSSYDPNDFGRYLGFGARRLYLAVDGEVSLVGRLPDGSIPADAAAGIGRASADHAISDDGSRIYFSTADEPGQVGGTGMGPLYLRDRVADETAVVSDDPNTTFFTATPDGHKALYRIDTTDYRDSNLYLYDAELGTSQEIAADDQPADGVDPKIVTVLATASDLSRVYFVARGALLSGQSSLDGDYGVYLWKDGAIKHIATLDEESVRSGGSEEEIIFESPYSTPPYFDAWVNQWFLAWSEDARVLVFNTKARVTGHETGGHHQVYRYDDQTGLIDCLSCPPDGPATSDAVVRSRLALVGTNSRPGLGRRGNVTADGGRTFFETGDALVPADVNGTVDVYLWEDGAPRLVSNGTSGSGARFVAASRTGDDVFIATAAPLVASDRDELVDIYDARVGGGWLEPSATTPECVGDACQGSSPRLPSTDGPSSDLVVGLSDGGSGRSAGGLRVSIAKTVRGISARVRVRVPSAGRFRVSGPGVRGVDRTTARAGTYPVVIRLSRSAARALGSDGRVRVGVTVRFTPVGGLATSKRVRVSFRKATGRGVSAKRGR